MIGLERIARMIAVMAVASAVTAAPLAACGHEPEPRPVVDEPAPKAEGPPEPWETMSFEARRTYMANHVLPRMRDVFKAYDPVRFADVRCGTCHGAGAQERHFAMPNADLPALYPSGHPKQIELSKQKPEILRFMFQTVVPEVRGLLGQPAWDPATKQGFSCFKCHPRGADTP